MSWRTKSKSGWLADGKPTSISLKPICTTVSNIRSLRAGSIGSMSAWLPSRRSTEHQQRRLRRSAGPARCGRGERRAGGTAGTCRRACASGSRVPGASGFLFGWSGVGAKKNLLPSAGGRRGERREGALAYISRRRSEAKVAGHVPSIIPPRPHARQGGLGSARVIRRCVPHRRCWLGRRWPASAVAARRVERRLERPAAAAADRAASRRPGRAHVEPPWPEPAAAPAARGARRADAPPAVGRARRDGVCPTSHPVKAKLPSKIFHLPGMANYERTNPDRCYAGAAEAEADGLPARQALDAAHSARRR